MCQKYWDSPSLDVVFSSDTWFQDDFTRLSKVIWITSCLRSKVVDLTGRKVHREQRSESLQTLTQLCRIARSNPSRY